MKTYSPRQRKEVQNELYVSLCRWRLSSLSLPWFNLIANQITNFEQKPRVARSLSHLHNSFTLRDAGETSIRLSRGTSSILGPRPGLRGLDSVEELELA